MGLGEEVVLAPGQTQEAVLCVGMWVHRLARHARQARVGSEAQHGGIGTQSGGPCCDGREEAASRHDETQGVC